MTSFILGLLIGVVIGRLFDLWVDWKYPKPKPRKFESKVPPITLAKDYVRGDTTITVNGACLPKSGEFEIVIDGQHYIVYAND